MNSTREMPNPVNLIGISTLLLATLLIACLPPARRACDIESRDALVLTE